MFPGSQKRFHYSDKDKKKLAGLLKMADVETSENLVFVGHDHLQHAGADWNRLHALRYHTNAILEQPELKDLVELTDGASLGRDSSFLGHMTMKHLMTSTMHRNRTV